MDFEAHMKPIELSHKIIDIAQALGADSDLHLVGGCVRDHLLGKVPKDYDFATVLHPEEVVNRCKKFDIPTIVTGIRRGTITAVIDHEPFEITTFRQKGKETNFSTTIEEDLSARDFTINAIAYNLLTDQLVDPYNGCKDIQLGILRMVGKAKDRFEEDPHRILRLCRFAAQFLFSVSREIIHDAQDCIPLLATIEPERINAELKKIFSILSGYPLRECLELLDLVGFFNVWIPELIDCKDVEQNKYHKFDVFRHILNVVRGCHTYHSKLAALFHDIGKPDTKTCDETGIHFYRHEVVSEAMAHTIMKRLKFSNDDIEKVRLLVREHMRSIEGGPKAVRKTKHTLGELFPDWMDLKKADKISGGTPDKELLVWMEKWKIFEENLKFVEELEKFHPIEKLAIDGHKIQEILNLKPGKEVGEILKACREKVFEDPKNNDVLFLTLFVLELKNNTQKVPIDESF